MKSMIIDDDKLVIGSMNFTKQGENVNDEDCLIIKNAPELTKKYKAAESFPPLSVKIWYSRMLFIGANPFFENINTLIITTYIYQLKIITDFLHLNPSGE